MQENNPIQLAFPELKMNESIRSQTQQMVQQRANDQRRKIRNRNTTLLTVGITLAAFMAISGGPKAYAYYRIQGLTGSVSDCYSAVIESFEVDRQDQMTPSSKTFYSAGKWRIEQPKRTYIYADHTLWNYSAATNQITKSGTMEGPFAFNSSGFSVKAIVSDLVRWKWNKKVNVGSGNLNGSPVEMLTIYEDGPYRSIIYADPATHMPIRMEQEKAMANHWKLVGYSTFKFNVPVAPKIFQPIFAKNSQLVDFESIKREWAAKLEKPIGEMHTSKNRLVIRDFAVNERGHVFIVFTNGETADDRKKYADAIRQRMPIRAIAALAPPTIAWNVQDSIGTQYLPDTSGSFQPYIDPVGRTSSKWIVLEDGEVLQGQWFIPRKFVAWSPRKITISCSFGSVKENSNSWSTNLSNPTDKLLPKWMVACALAPKDSTDLEKAEHDIHLVPDMIPLDPKTGKPKTDANGVVKQTYHYGR